MTPEEAIAELRTLKDADNEVAHERADNILIVVLRTLAPEVSYEYEVLREKVGFWYA